MSRLSFVIRKMALTVFGKSLSKSIDLLEKFYFCNLIIKTMEATSSIIITVLAALLTGGFLMLTIENVHLSASVTDRYYSVMKPFCHRLTNYINFINMVRYHFRFKKTDNDYTNDLKHIIDEITKFKGQSEIGLDISPSSFSAKELEEFCETNIGNVWYYLSEKWNYIKDDMWFENNGIDDITKEFLCEVSSKYQDDEINFKLVANMSDDFYRNIYQPIQLVPYQYENWQTIEKWFRIMNIISIITNLLSIMCIALFEQRFFNCIYHIILMVNVLSFLVVYVLYMVIDKKSRRIIRV